jgi:hypothetical protein
MGDGGHIGEDGVRMTVITIHTDASAHGSVNTVSDKVCPSDIDFLSE